MEHPNGHGVDHSGHEVMFRIQPGCHPVGCWAPGTIWDPAFTRCGSALYVPEYLDCCDQRPVVEEGRSIKGD